MTIAGEDRKLFAESLRVATETASGATLDATLRDLGWHDALEADPQVAISLLFDLQGRANATSSALDDVLCRALGHPDLAVLLPPVGGTHAPGVAGPDGVRVRALASAATWSRRAALVVADHGGDRVGCIAEMTALSRRPVSGLDPALGLVEISGSLEGAPEIGPVDWERALVLGRLALGHELVGASRRMLELARGHALDRIQFGRPIAMFQAVRHRLAETLVAIEAADALLGAAWVDESPDAAAMAKAVAGRSARTAARHCQQVLAGTGFTTEHPLHRYVRRVVVLDQLLGSSHALTRDLGERILETEALPALPPL